MMLHPGELRFVTVALNVSSTPWWFVDNNDMTDVMLFWLERPSPLVLLSYMIIGGTEVWRILTSKGVVYAHQLSIINYTRREDTL